MRAWLVDGNNVYGSRPDGWWRDRTGAAARLVDEVAAWQSRTGEPLTLVFDGRRPVAVEAAKPGLDVRFAADEGEASADDLIARLAALREGALTVVTSDRGLVARLPVGVDVEGASRFLARLAEQ